jgi:hypothetical protein
MKKGTILGHIALLSALFAGMHIVALKMSLYWTTDWLDSIMHIFGGFLGTLIVVYILQKVGISPRTLPRKMFLLAFVVISVFAVGVVWELWEIFTGWTDPFVYSEQVDTVSDLVMDIIGSLIGFMYYDKRLRTKAE